MKPLRTAKLLQGPPACMHTLLSSMLLLLLARHTLTRPSSSQLTSSQPRSSAHPPRRDWKAEPRLVIGLLLWCKLAAGLMLMPGLMLNTCNTPHQHRPVRLLLVASPPADAKARHAWHAWCAEQSQQ